MITEGIMELMAKCGENTGVIGFWYPNTLTFIFIMLCVIIVSVLAVIGLFTVLKMLLAPKKKKY